MSRFGSRAHGAFPSRVRPLTSCPSSRKTSFLHRSTVFCGWCRGKHAGVLRFGAQSSALFSSSASSLAQGGERIGSLPSRHRWRVTCWWSRGGFPIMPSERRRLSSHGVSTALSCPPVGRCKAWVATSMITARQPTSERPGCGRRAWPRSWCNRFLLARSIGIAPTVRRWPSRRGSPPTPLQRHASPS